LGLANDQAQADRLAEGDWVKTKELGTVVGTTKNCVSIQRDGRTTPEIFTTAEYPQGGGSKMTTCGYAQVSMGGQTLPRKFSTTADLASATSHEFDLAARTSARWETAIRQVSILAARAGRPK
jgi:hypothetical protein